MSQGIKHDEGKTKWAYAPWHAFEAIMDVMHYGAEKYDWNNWRQGLSVSRLWSAAMRHMRAYLGGEDLDPESGLPHLSHAACCLVFLLESRLRGFGSDDRREVTRSTGGSGSDKVQGGGSRAVADREDRICPLCQPGYRTYKGGAWPTRGEDGTVHWGDISEGDWGV